jgi:hypothetical protein
MVNALYRDAGCKHDDQSVDAELVVHGGDLRIARMLWPRPTNAVSRELRIDE